MMSAREAARIEPLVAREGLRGAGVYYDMVVKARVESCSCCIVVRMSD